MASHKVVRRPTGGTRIRFWADTALMAALQAEADAHGITLSAAARRVLDQWLERQPAKSPQGDAHMNRQEVIDQLVALAGDAKPDVPQAASVLLTLAASLTLGTDDRLCGLVATFAKHEVGRLS